MTFDYFADNNRGERSNSQFILKIQDAIAIPKEINTIMWS